MLIKNALEQALLKQDQHVFLLDVDDLGYGFNQGIGSKINQNGYIGRIGEAAKLFADLY